MTTAQMDFNDITTLANAGFPALFLVVSTVGMLITTNAANLHFRAYVSSENSYPCALWTCVLVSIPFTVQLLRDNKINFNNKDNAISWSSISLHCLYQIDLIKIVPMLAILIPSFILLLVYEKVECNMRFTVVVCQLMTTSQALSISDGGYFIGNTSQSCLIISAFIILWVSRFQSLRTKITLQCFGVVLHTIVMIGRLIDKRWMGDPSLNENNSDDDNPSEPSYFMHVRKMSWQWFLLSFLLSATWAVAFISSTNRNTIFINTSVGEIDIYMYILSLAITAITVFSISSSSENIALYKQSISERKNVAKFVTREINSITSQISKRVHTLLDKNKTDTSKEHEAAAAEELDLMCSIVHGLSCDVDDAERMLALWSGQEQTWGAPVPVTKSLVDVDTMLTTISADCDIKEVECWSLCFHGKNHVIVTSCIFH